MSKRLRFIAITGYITVERTVADNLSDIEIEQIKNTIKEDIKKEYSVPEHKTISIVDCENIDFLDDRDIDAFID